MKFARWLLAPATIIAMDGPRLWAAEPTPPDVEARAIRSGIPSPPVCPTGPSKCSHLNVRLSLLIGQDGKVLDIVIVDASGIDSVDYTAIDYVRNWPFSPAQKA